MVEENDIGQSVCRKCKGDFYACDCPMIHVHSCSHFIETFRAASLTKEEN